MKNYFNKLLILIIICALTFADKRQAATAFSSAKTYARVEKNLAKAKEFGLIAYEFDPSNADIVYFLAKEVYLPLQERDKAGEKFVEALSLEDDEIDKSFNIGNTSIRTIHQAVALYADDFYNYAIDSYNKKDLENSISRFNIALKLDSKHIKSMLGLADIYYNNDDYKNIETALGYMDQALDISSGEDKKQIIIKKTFYLRKDHRYNQAIKLLELNKNLIGIQGQRELFLIYLDTSQDNQENLNNAINLGQDLVDKMIETGDINEISIISETGFNLAISYRQRAMQNYNKVVEYISSNQKNKNLNTEYIELSKKIKKDLEQTTHYFLVSVAYDDNISTSSESKEYRLEARELLKKVDTLLLSSLQNE